MVESTTAGIAAGITGRKLLDDRDVIKIQKRLAVINDGREIDMALVDVVVLSQLFTGARAIWELSEIRQIICTRAEPINLGMTAIGGNIHPIGPNDAQGMYLRLGNGHLKVKAAVLPGVVQEVGIQEWKLLEPGDEVVVNHKPSVIALDGEREVTVRDTDEVKIRLQHDGPSVVDIEKTVRAAAEQGFFRN